MPLTMIESLAIGLRRDADLPQKPAEDFVGVEELTGDRPRHPAMSLVVRQDSFGAGGGLVERAERHEALADGQMPAEAGVLHERRLARGEITDRPVAEPATV